MRYKVTFGVSGMMKCAKAEDLVHKARESFFSGWVVDRVDRWLHSLPSLARGILHENMKGLVDKAITPLLSAALGGFVEVEHADGQIAFA